MSRRDESPADEGDNPILPVLHRLADQRYAAAQADVARLRAEHPDDDAETLADRLIRRYAKELAIGGAVAGGAAASPVAGVAVAAASAGADATYSTGRLSEMIMAIGLVYGHVRTTADDRSAAIATVMGIADGAAVGMSSLAARAGARGGARVLRRLPSGAAPAGAGAGSRAVARLARTKGPWGVAALVPYGIGAGVGAAGNAMLARAVGRAAKEYFATHPGPSEGDSTDGPLVVEVLDDETELLAPDDGHEPGRTSGPDAAGSDDIVDAEIIELGEHDRN